MKRVSVYRCKNCHALLDCDKLTLLDETGFDQSIASKSNGVALQAGYGKHNNGNNYSQMHPGKYRHLRIDWLEEN